MKSIDIKKQFLSSREMFTAKNWEGKPFSYKVRYCFARYPECFIATVGFLFLFPPLVYYRYITFKGSKRDALEKFRYNYLVVRDDDPRVENFRREKEFGKEFFPEY